MEPNREKKTDNKRLIGVPAKTLTKQGFAICFFPEQPERKLIAIPPPPPPIEETLQKVETKTVEAFAFRKPKIDLEPEPEPKNVEEVEYIRERWESRLIYIIAFSSFSLSLNNVCFFPLHVYRFGGTFIFAYTLFTILLGYPLHTLQASLGQYGQRGILKIWDCAPLARGVGYSMLTSCIVVSLYHNVFAAYALVYFSHSFTQSLPWTRCNGIFSADNPCVMAVCDDFNTTHAAKHYFYSNILNTPHRTPGDHDLGPLKWWLVLAFFFSWFVVYVSTLQSARSIGKVSIFCNIFVYFAYLTLFIAILQVQNSKSRLTYSTTVSQNFLVIFSFELWSKAAIQVLLELGLCHGIPLVYGSFCHFRNLVYIDSIFSCSINYVNSMLFMLLFYFVLRSFPCSSLEFAPYIFNNGLGIIFMIFAELLQIISGSNLWCTLFFSMVFLIVIGTQIALVETVTLCFYDYFNKLSKFRWLINLLICLLFFLLGLIFCTANGFYALNLMHTLSIFFTVLPLVICFMVGILFCYGLDKYFENMSNMLVSNNSSFAFLKSLLYIIFVVLVFMFLLSFAEVSPVVGPRYTYSVTGVGWGIMALILIPSVLWVLLWVLYSLYNPEKEVALDSSKSWHNHNEKVKSSEGPFATEYDSSFIWNWRRRQEVI